MVLDPAPKAPGADQMAVGEYRGRQLLFQGSYSKITLPINLPGVVLGLAAMTSARRHFNFILQVTAKSRI